jgi:outer membrane protein assembly factor BamB
MAGRAKVIFIFLPLFLFMSSADGADFKPPVRLKWVTKLKKEKVVTKRPYQFASPVMAENVIYVGAASGFFYALSPKTGFKIWHTKLKGGVYSEPYVDADSIYVADRKGIVYALNKKDGHIEWQIETGEEISSKPAVDGDVIYVATTQKQIMALDKYGRGKKWQTSKVGSLPQMTIKSSSSPAIYNGSIYVGYADGTFNCYKASDGELVWSKQLSDRASQFIDIDGAPLILDGIIYISSMDGKTHAVNPMDGSIIWQADRGGPNDVVTDGEKLYIVGGGRLAAADLKNGNILWEQDFHEIETSSPAVKDGFLSLISTKEKLYIVDSQTGEIKYKRYLGKGSFGKPIVSGDILYILTNSSSVFALQGS